MGVFFAMKSEKRKKKIGQDRKISKFPFPPQSGGKIRNLDRFPSHFHARCVSFRSFSASIRFAKARRGPLFHVGVMTTWDQAVLFGGWPDFQPFLRPIRHRTGSGSWSAVIPGTSFLFSSFKFCFPNFSSFSPVILDG